MKNKLLNKHFRNISQNFEDLPGQNVRGGSRSFKFKLQEDTNQEIEEWKSKSLKDSITQLRKIFANVNKDIHGSS